MKRSFFKLNHARRISVKSSRFPQFATIRRGDLVIVGCNGRSILHRLFISGVKAYATLQLKLLMRILLVSIILIATYYYRHTVNNHGGRFSVTTLKKWLVLRHESSKYNFTTHCDNKKCLLSTFYPCLNSFKTVNSNLDT